MASTFRHGGGGCPSRNPFCRPGITWFEPNCGRQGDLAVLPPDGGGRSRGVAALPMTEDFFEGGQKEAVAVGDGLYQRGEFRAAIRKWQGILESEELTPGQQEQIRRRIAAANHQRALLSMNQKPSRKSLEQALTRLEEALRWDRESAPILFEMGRCHLRRGDLEQAEVYFERAMRGRGADDRIAYHAAALKVRLGRPGEALRILEEWTPGGSAVSEGRWTRLKALAAAASGRVEEALALLRTAPPGIAKEAWLRDVQALTLAARPGKALCERLEAIRGELSEDGETMSPAERSFLRLLGDIYGALGEDEKAVATWLEAAEGREGEHASRVLGLCERRVLEALREGDYEGAEQWCSRMVEATKADPAVLELVARTYLLKGNALWQLGKREEAAEAWRRSCDVRPGIEAAWNLAVAASAAGDWATAAECWRSVWELASGRGEADRARAAAMQRARALFYLGDAKGMQEALETVVKHRPDPDLTKLLAFHSLAVGEYSRAVDLFKRLLPEHDSDADVQAGLAMAYDLTGADLETSLLQWEKAVALCDDETLVDRWRTLTLAHAMRTWQAEDSARAMRLFANLLLRNPGDVDGWIWCGMLHLEREDEKKAAACFEEAIRIDPNSTSTLIKIGGCYLKSGRQEEAEAYFSRACAISAGPPVRLRIAEVCVDVGRDDLAAAHLCEGIAACKGPTPDFYRMIRLIIRVRGEDQIRSLIEEAAKVVPESNLVRILGAVQHLKAFEWRAALEALRAAQAEADSSGDAATRDDVEYLSKVLILSMTVGEIDRQEFDRRIVAMVDRWVSMHAPDPSGPAVEELWKARASERLQAYRAAIDGGVDVWIDSSGVSDLKPLFEVERARFNQPLNVVQLLEDAPA